MKKIALIYGGISGGIAISAIMLGLRFSEDSDLLSSEFFGYLSMLVALSLVFIGVKKYRDEQKGGVIKFGPAFLAGLAIAVVAGVTYTFIWEIYSMSTNYAFIDNYSASMIEAKKASGLTGAVLEAEIADVKDMMANYRNPFFRLPLTFMEIFPVGFIVSLISAAVLRNPKMFPARG